MKPFKFKFKLVFEFWVRLLEQNFSTCRKKGFQNQKKARWPIGRPSVSHWVPWWDWG